jgi:hypothetical protein
MELLGFTPLELAVLAAVLVALFVALQVARFPRSGPASSARAVPARLLIALLLVGVIGASWAAIRYARTRSTEAALRAARCHGVEVEKLRRGGSGGSGAKRQRRRAGAQAVRNGSEERAQQQDAEGEEEDAEGEEEEGEGEETEEDAPQRPLPSPQPEEELFSAALLEGEGEAEYAARRLRADAELSRRAAVQGMVGGARASSASLMQQPRHVAEAAGWVGGDAKLSRAITLEGMRSHTASTLFAREDYAALEQANHGYGEGMDLRYVDPSLRNFDYAFAAYDDAPVPPNPLPGNTPMLF